VSGEIRCSTYNHYLGPNATRADCVTYSVDPATLYSSVGWRTGRSWHPGGVNLLLADGSVRFTKDSIALSLWRALATRASGEVISDD
jgi:prepilin-type processing-associated H-X9-DG protein